MYQFLQKFISLCLLFALFLFGNMALVHASSNGEREIVVEHTHGKIRETHIIETSGSPEPSHCSGSDITSSVIFQSRDIYFSPLDVSDIADSLYGEYICVASTFDEDRYAHYYP